MSRCFLFLPLIYLLNGHLLSAEDFQLYPAGISYDPAIPTLEDVVGHGWGEQISSVSQIETYLQKLAQATPKIALVPYAESWENKTLYYLIVTSNENMRRLKEIKRGIKQLAFSTSDPGEVETMLESLPSVVWLLYGVHGNEISSPDAALLTAYHLAGAINDDLVKDILKECVVIIDPLQNPDGRARFVSYLQQTQGRWPDPDPQAAEHNEVWPSGRSNHYLFDMNRDWFARTQPETRGRIETYLEWYPQIVIDFHEMEGDSTYFFGPPAKPFNPELTSAQLEWLTRLGRNNARWFDRMQFDYFTREVFDSFYPGYGEDWPMFHGSIGMTYEQASTRGMAFLRKDETTLHFRQSIQHHFIASLATLESAASNRLELLEYFCDYRSSAKDDSPIAEFILDPRSDPNRAAKLAANLVAQGIEVRRAEEPFRNEEVFDYYDSTRRAVEFAQGAYLISTDQPGGKMVKTLIGQNATIDDEFLKQQERRLENRLEPQFYDLTGWSLPLLFDVDCYVTGIPCRVRTTPVGRDIVRQGGMKGGKSNLAYLIPWDSNSAARMLAALQRQTIRVYGSDKPFAIEGVKFPRGSLIIKVKGNQANLYEHLTRLASEMGVHVYSAETSWVESGVNFGSNQVRYLKRPRVAMAYSAPTRPSSAGATRFLLEQGYGYPVTVIHTHRLDDADLSRYNVLILPDDAGESIGYSALLGEKGISRLKEWVNLGGTLIAIGGASKWLTGEKVELLATTTEKRPSNELDCETGEPDAAGTENEPQNKSDEELPVRTPGAILRVSLDQEHWLTAGYNSNTNVLVNSSRVFSPLQLDRGRNLAVYTSKEDLLLSGFMWEEAKELLAGKAYLMHQEVGKGHVIAFAEDPNFRALVEGLNLLFMNGVFFGPSH